MWWRLLADVHNEHWVFRGWSQIEEICSEWLLCREKCLVEIQGQFWPITSIAVGSLCPESTESLISRLWNTSCVWWHALWRSTAQSAKPLRDCSADQWYDWPTNWSSMVSKENLWRVVKRKLCQSCLGSHSTSVVPQCIKYKYLDAFYRHWSWLK